MSCWGEGVVVVVLYGQADSRGKEREDEFVKEKICKFFSLPEMFSCRRAQAEMENRGREPGLSLKG